MSDHDYCAGSGLCAELRGLPDNSFALTYQGDPPDRVVAATSQFRIIADLSPLTVGHLLVVPVTHHLGFGHLVGANSTEIAGLLDRMLPEYERTFGSPAILEHGSSSDMSTSACVAHAHWHLFPVDVAEVNRRMVRDGLEQVELAGFADLGDLARRDRSYYYCSDGERHWVYESDGRLRRQYLRAIVAEMVGIPEPCWDYSLVVRKELLRETMSRVSRWKISVGV